MTHFAQKIMARLTARLGQPSLEYIAIAVVLVILVIIAFNFLGGQINTKSKTVGNSINCPPGTSLVGNACQPN